MSSRVNMPSETETKVRVISQSYNSWKVQVLFSDRDLSAAEISERLQQVKRELAQQYRVADQLLEYSALLDKVMTRSGLLVSMLITRQHLPSGAPRFHRQPLQTEDGTRFTDMLLLADLYPFDELERPMDRQQIQNRLVQEQIDLTCVDWKKVDALVKQLEETQAPVRGAEIARGQLPSVGKPSKVVYGALGRVELHPQTAWIGMYPVANSDFLVEVEHFGGGHRAGKNLFGRELAPREGTETRIEAGSGARLLARGTHVAATRGGLVQFYRAGRDRRERDCPELRPAKILVQVLSAAEYIGGTVLEIGDPGAVQIQGDVREGSRISAAEGIYIEGDVAADTELAAEGSIRIIGNLRGARIHTTQHLCIIGNAQDCQLHADLTIQIEGTATDCTISAMDVVARQVRGGSVNALRRTAIDSVDHSAGVAAAVSVNLRRFLELQQTANRDALADLRHSLMTIIGIFGSTIVQEAESGSIQRVLMKWLRLQKSKGIDNYTRAEVQEYRTVLEMIPLIRTQLTAIGVELRDVTAQLMSESEPDGEAAG